MNNLDLLIYSAITLAIVSFIFIIWGYVKTLRNSPRELWFLYASKIIEYGAYGAANLSFVLYLSKDCGLSDIKAGSFIGFWSIFVTIATILVGSVVDAIGVRRTLLMGTIFLILGRIVFPLTNNIYLVATLGFFPIALGIGILGPVLSIGVKRWTTRETSTLGFGLLYTLFNVGWALGGWIFDRVRVPLGGHAIVQVPFVGSMSTYQIIFATSFFLTFPVLFLTYFMREGVEFTAEGKVVINPPKEKMVGNIFTVMGAVIRKAAADTIKIFKSVVSEKSFWVYIGMLGLLVFIRLVFFHFHYTFPKYGTRVLGEAVKIGSIYSVLNPVMIVFLTPAFSVLTRKISSYRMMIVGTLISCSAIFVASLPGDTFASLMNTWVGEIVFNRWLEVPLALQKPVFLNLVFMVIIFTTGEAIWSPRLLQFSAEIAPHGKDGTYVAMSYLPYFLAKMIAGPLSGWLVQTYTPEGASSYPNHFWVWIWIGGMAFISPLGLIIFRKVFYRAEMEHGERAARA